MTVYVDNYKILDLTVDLSSAIGPTGYLGFTASTGYFYFSSSTIMSWEFSLGSRFCLDSLCSFLLKKRLPVFFPVVPDFTKTRVIEDGAAVGTLGTGALTFHLDIQNSCSHPWFAVLCLYSLI